MSHQTVLESLEAAGVRATRRGDTLELSVDTGPYARTAKTDPDALEAMSRHFDDAELDAPAFARGVVCALSEPKNSRGGLMAFVDAARTIMPLADRVAFSVGVNFVHSEWPLSTGFGAQLALYFVVELDRGIRIVPLSQFEAWGAELDRVERAAASILFHRSRDVQLRPSALDARFDELAVGDDHDPARALILDALDFDRCRRGCAVAFVAPNRLLVSRDLAVDTLAALTAAVATGPVLSRQIVRFEGGHMVRTE
jgi:hypothetical protein